MDQANNEFTINITSYSKTECTFFIASTWLSTKRTYSYIFYWVAIDDKRIEVIDCFNYNFTNKASQDISFSHTNMNALQGFITTTSLGYLGSINYSLAISSITIDNVIVSFKTSNTNLLSVGFQIVLGIPEAFTLSDLYSQKISPSITYVSGNLQADQKKNVPMNCVYPYQLVRNCLQLYLLCITIMLRILDLIRLQLSQQQLSIIKFFAGLIVI